MRGAAGGKLAELGGKMLSRLAGKITTRFFAKVAKATRDMAEE